MLPPSNRQRTLLIHEKSGLRPAFFVRVRWRVSRPAMPAVAGCSVRFDAFDRAHISITRKSTTRPVDADGARGHARRMHAHVKPVSKCPHHRQSPAHSNVKPRNAALVIRWRTPDRRHHRRREWRPRRAGDRCTSSGARAKYCWWIPTTIACASQRSRRHDRGHPPRRCRVRFRRDRGAQRKRGAAHQCDRGENNASSTGTPRGRHVRRLAERPRTARQPHGGNADAGEQGTGHCGHGLRTTGLSSRYAGRRETLTRTAWPRRSPAP